MVESVNKTNMNTQEAFEGSLEEIIGTLEDRQNQLLSQINKLNLMNLKTNARISKIEEQLETRPSKDSSEIESIESSGEFEKLKSEVNELEKDLELISEFLLNNDGGSSETTTSTDEDREVVKENRDVEEEIEILNNKVEGVMDRLNTVLNIEESHSSNKSSANKQSSQTGENGLSDNAEAVLEKLKELDDVSVDKLVENTGMNREEIKEAYKELKNKGKV